MSNTSLTKELKKYYRDVKDHLICDNKTKQRIIASLKEDISIKLETCSISSIDDIIEIFGTPEQIAANYRIEDFIKINNTKRVITKAVIIALSIIVLIIFAYFAFVLIGDLISGNGYVEVDVRDTSENISVSAKLIYNIYEKFS